MLDHAQQAPRSAYCVASCLFRAHLIGRLLDECTIGRVAESCSVGPYRLDVCALKQGEPVPVGLVRKRDGEADGWFVEAAVVVQLADSTRSGPQPECLPRR
jgi:hypothetical protein